MRLMNAALRLRPPFAHPSARFSISPSRPNARPGADQDIDRERHLSE